MGEGNTEASMLAMRNNFEPDRHETVLEALNYHRIFFSWLSQEKRHLIFEEGCDGWFRLPLNKKEVGQLIRELTLIWEKMEGE